MKESMERHFISLLIDAVTVITNPANFFRTMPKQDGFMAPVTFIIIMGVFTGIIKALLDIVGIGIETSFTEALSFIISVPLGMVFSSFVGAAILYFVWKFIGSKESYETAYRCGAYTAAIFPIATLLCIFPYVGTLIGLVWLAYLLVTASTAVHQLPSITAWLFFGTLCALLALISTCTQHKERKLEQERIALMEWQEKTEQLTPEQAGRAMREVLARQDDGSGKAMKEFLRALGEEPEEEAEPSEEETIPLYLEKQKPRPEAVKDEPSNDESCP